MLDEAEECNIHIVTQRANNASAPTSLNIFEFSTSSCWNILACRFSSYEHAGYWTRCSMMISMGIISVECNIMLWRNMPENNDIGWHLYVVTIMSILGSASIRATSCAQDCVVTIHARWGVHIVMLHEHVWTLPRLTHTAHELAPNFANVFEYVISDCVQNSTILGGFIDRAG